MIGRGVSAWRCFVAILVAVLVVGTTALAGAAASPFLSPAGQGAQASSYVYDAASTSTTHATNTRTDARQASPGPRTPSRFSTSQIRHFRAAKAEGGGLSRLKTMLGDETGSFDPFARPGRPDKLKTSIGDAKEEQTKAAQFLDKLEGSKAANPNAPTSGNRLVRVLALLARLRGGG